MQHHPLHHCSPNFHTAAASIFGVFSLSMSPFHVTPRVREISRGILLHCFCLKRLLPIAMYRTSTAPQFAFCHRRLSPLQELSATPADRLPPLVKSCFKDFFRPISMFGIHGTGLQAEYWPISRHGHLGGHTMPLILTYSCKCSTNMHQAMIPYNHSADVCVERFMNLILCKHSECWTP